MQSQQQSAQNNSGSAFDNAQVIQLLTSLAQGQQNQAKDMHNYAKEVQNQARKVNELEKQIRQISEFLGQFSEQGKLPSSTIVNPKGGFETVKAITLRSGKEVGTNPQASQSARKEDKKLLLEEEEGNKATARDAQPLPQPPTPPRPSQTTKVSLNSNFSSSIPLNAPFPSRFMQSKNEEEEQDILETFRKVHVNIPLLDAIKQIPKYAKFLKKLCTTRKRIREKRSGPSK